MDEDRLPAPVGLAQRDLARAQAEPIPLAPCRNPEFEVRHRRIPPRLGLHEPHPPPSSDRATT